MINARENTATPSMDIYVGALCALDEFKANELQPVVQDAPGTVWVLIMAFEMSRSYTESPCER